MEDKKKNIFKEASTYFLILVAVILIRTFLFTPVRVNGSSMVPTLTDKEIMILNKAGKMFSSFKRFDIVVIDYKSDKTKYEEKLIKRVIGLPGESLKYENNILYINGEEIFEDYSRDVTADFDITNFGYDKIPDDCYIVMGDNRNNSTDSRVLGCIPKKMILGNANLVIYPFSNFGVKK